MPLGYLEAQFSLWDKSIFPISREIKGMCSVVNNEKQERPKPPVIIIIFFMMKNLTWKVRLDKYPIYLSQQLNFFKQ